MNNDIWNTSTYTSTTPAEPVTLESLSKLVDSLGKQCLHAELAISDGVPESDQGVSYHCTQCLEPIIIPRKMATRASGELATVIRIGPDYMPPMLAVPEKLHTLSFSESSSSIFTHPIIFPDPLCVSWSLGTSSPVREIGPGRWAYNLYANEINKRWQRSEHAERQRVEAKRKKQQKRRAIRAAIRRKRRGLA